MKSIRFSKVVEKSGKPEVYLLLSETDSEFHRALEAEKILSLSDEQGSGAEYGTVGYDKKRRGQLLIFPKSLKSFANTRIVGIKYDLFADDDTDEKESRSGNTKRAKRQKEKPSKRLAPKKLAAEKAPKTKAKAKAPPAKLIPFPARHEEPDDEEDNALKANVRQAMRAFEKGNSVAAYNILKRIVPDS